MANVFVPRFFLPRKLGWLAQFKGLLFAVLTFFTRLFAVWIRPRALVLLAVGRQVGVRTRLALRAAVHRTRADLRDTRDFFYAIDKAAGRV
jgi:hypothetical protein